MSSERPQFSEVDFSRSAGTIRPLHGTNFGPLYGSMDLSNRFRHAGFPSIRLHDCPFVCRDTVDTHYLFPLFGLDETDSANWTFGPTDVYLAAIKALGANIVYRLGPSIEHTPVKHFVHPPPDFDKWARICCQIIRHYNQGWADGFEYNITDWEIWNEPWHPSMWTGTDEEWFRLYETASKAIKQQFPDIRVGGGDALRAWSSASAGDFSERFMSYCRSHDCPMDFFAWHIYARTPKEVIESARRARQQCEDFGYGHVDLALNEWNWFPEKDWHYRKDTGRTQRFFDNLASADAAAFTAATLSFLQDEPVSQAHWYAPFLGRWGMFDSIGRPRKQFYAFVAFSNMMKTPRRVAASGTNLDSGLSILAGLSNDERQGRVLLSNFAAADVTTVRLTLKNLPPGRWMATEYLHNDALDLQPMASHALATDANADEPPALELSLPPATVRLVELDRV
jgi:hypothetical protein